ncbi:hypothetical protein NZD85_11475 [Empedobacter stercoris]|uniref:Uncharacterized protein n=1 Tax=Empedobacter falsenii TaxID=343874 RepID=A0ABY8V5A8_9FLAO|nr:MULTISPECIES: hypothetical protein [Empedobacter]UWX66496.1 hypothetical protein NZD85_11475 [Empedobacter stercoris]WIH96678.1 hypothetical protein OBA43_10450 [Empedobacter falsenii]
MDIIQAILDFISAPNFNKENTQKDKAGYFLFITSLISIALFFLSSDLFENQHFFLILISIIGVSIILNIVLIFILIKFKIIQPTTFNNFIFYLIGLILLVSSFGLFLIDYFKIISN